MKIMQFVLYDQLPYTYMFTSRKQVISISPSLCCIYWCLAHTFIYLQLVFICINFTRALIQKISVYPFAKLTNVVGTPFQW